jgi:hypothetical protein
MHVLGLTFAQNLSKSVHVNTETVDARPNEAALSFRTVGFTPSSVGKTVSGIGRAYVRLCPGAILYQRCCLMLDDMRHGDPA